MPQTPATSGPLTHPDSFHTSFVFLTAHIDFSPTSYACAHTARMHRHRMLPVSSMALHACVTIPWQYLACNADDAQLRTSPARSVHGVCTECC